MIWTGNFCSLSAVQGNFDNDGNVGGGGGGNFIDVLVGVCN